MFILDKIDSTFVALFLSAIVSLYGILLFGYEWWRKKEASFIFKSITILFVGEFLDNAIGAYGRWMSLNLPWSNFGEFRTSWVWSGKYYITTTVLTLICWYITKKMLTARKNGHIVVERRNISERRKINK